MNEKPQYEIREDGDNPLDWRFECGWDPYEKETIIFSGPDPEKMAREYAAWKTSQGIKRPAISIRLAMEFSQALSGALKKALKTNHKIIIAYADDCKAEGFWVTQLPEAHVGYPIVARIDPKALEVTFSLDVLEQEG